MEVENHLKHLAPSGFVLALFYKLGGPELFLTTYPREWVAEYERSALHWADPVVLFTTAKTGPIRWSEIPFPDVRNVLGRAKTHGLKYGVTTSTNTKQGKHILSVCRSDREYTQSEISEVETTLAEAVAEYTNKPRPTDAEIQILQCLANGMTVNEGAKHINISNSSAKERLARAKKRLDAKTNIQAVAISIRTRLID